MGFCDALVALFDVTYVWRFKKDAKVSTIKIGRLLDITTLRIMWFDIAAIEPSIYLM